MNYGLYNPNYRFMKQTKYVIYVIRKQGYTIRNLGCKSDGSILYFCNRDTNTVH